MKFSKLFILLFTLLSNFSFAQSAIVAVAFGGDYTNIGDNINTAAPPSQLETGDYNFSGSATDRVSFVTLGQVHTAPNDAKWTTPPGKSGAVIRYGYSIANIGSSVDPSFGLARFNGSAAQALQKTSGAGTTEMRMASAWYWDKSSFLGGADTEDSLTFADQAGSLSANFLNGGTPTAGNTRHARFMVQSNGSWYLSADVFGGTSGTLAVNAAEGTWHSFDPDSASLLFYNPSEMGSGVLGSSLTNITAIGVHVQHELFDGSSIHAAGHQFNSLEAAVIPEPATVTMLLGLGAFTFVMIRRRFLVRSN